MNDLALVFLDESTVRMQSTVRRTWAPRGSTPIHRNSGRWDSIRAIAALTVAPKTGATALDYWLSEKSVDSEQMAFLLRDLFNQRGQDCILIWDNYPAHKPTARMMTTPGWPMAPKVAIDIQYLPTYAPDFNPVEQVWKSVKYDDLANYVPTDLAALKARLDQSLRGVQDRPELLRSFVRWAGFDLDESH